ncbi:NaeI family type II restriction endonuclease [Streptomyces sp. NBC_01077]|uniref:NaeI family type II restriction endonuclease n=1 Tax=Streptomyces sp. NBC_01077 TaxID=2903746 RepID=UPI00386D34D8|nr:NaeI family type II restriction endonuclease [Streptomyces sp. NBC_01077]
MFPLDITAAANIHAEDLRREDAGLAAVHGKLHELDPGGLRFAAVLRDTIDQLLNGEITGRYDWQTLFKTEKTHAGTLVEINLQREFGFDDGIDMDYQISDIDVDCKYSQQLGGWMIPPEALGHLCLLVWADDYTSQWSAGLLRIRKEWLNAGNNRDKKLTVKAEHRNKILWLWHKQELPENTLLHMDPVHRAAVYEAGSGQARLNELFRRCQQRRIGRNVVRTVAQQKDYMKRVRGNGGSRSSLKDEGIIILGDYRSHQEIADQLGVPIPREGEFVSVCVTPADGIHAGPRTVIDGSLWTVATAGDAVVAAPTLPSPSSKAKQ